MADLDYANDLEKIGRLVEQLESSPVISNFDTWYHTFVHFINKRRKAEFGANLLPDNRNYSEALFQQDIVTFLADPDGVTFKNNFEFPRSGNNTDRVLLSSMKFNHVPFETTAKAITGMKDTFEKIKAIAFSGNVFATSEPYTMWIMIDIITEELVRNISLALLVIFICTFILVMEFATSLLVLLTVGLTIVDTAGFLQFWGLFLDQDFAIFLTISIGLCVDYSAHVAHCFMVTQVRLWIDESKEDNAMVMQGSRDERMVKTLTHIGPAVFNGGLSTFCAFVLLAFSKSQTFLAFFKVFFLVVSFGLFHGLIFLPVVLSLIGPKSQHLDIADEPEEQPTWAEKSVSNIGFLKEQVNWDN